jgi:hypothetical protein
MSWSQQGSFALSTLDTLVRNDTVVRAAHRRLLFGRVAIDRTGSVLSSRRQGQGRAAPALRACRAPDSSGSATQAMARRPRNPINCLQRICRAPRRLSEVVDQRQSTSRFGMPPEHAARVQGPCDPHRLRNPHWPHRGRGGAPAFIAGSPGSTIRRRRLHARVARWTSLRHLHVGRLGVA